MTPERREEVIDIAERLLGSAGDLEFDAFTREELAIIDDITMQCDTCGWWVESDDVNDDQNCSDCAGEQ